VSLRATDVKDEHGWQIVNEKGEIVGHQPSRDKARHAAKNGFSVLTGETITWEEGDPPKWIQPPPLQPVAEEIQVLPADNSPEAILAREAWKVSERIKATTEAIRGLWVELAADLYIFKEGKMWEALGFETMDAYFADPDVEIGIRYAYDLITAYKQLVVDRGMAPEEMKQLDVSKVKEALPAIRRNQVTLEEAVADIKTLSKSSIITKYSGRASSTPGKPDTKTAIETDKEPMWGQCPTCGSRKQVDPETGEFIR
jgi:hypothetical protein